jgi:hypothetical protein
MCVLLRPLVFFFLSHDIKKHPACLHTLPRASVHAGYSVAGFDLKPEEAAFMRNRI